MSKINLGRGSAYSGSCLLRFLLWLLWPVESYHIIMNVTEGCSLNGHRDQKKKKNEEGKEGIGV